MGRHLLRFLGLAAGVALLTAETCAKDNLGNVRPGPVSFRVSIARNTVEANGPSDSGSISADGRYACFASTAKNLANPNSTFKEIYLRDRWNDTVENVSKLMEVFDPNTKQDCQRPYMSSNANYVVFECKGELAWDISSGPPPGEAFAGVLNIFRIDRTTDPPELKRIPQSDELNQDCTNASVSDDGRYVAFVTGASNVPGVTNSASIPQVYVYDNQSNTTTLISHSTGGATTICNRSATNPRISADGTFVTFESFASDLTVGENPSFFRQIWVAANDGTGVELVSRATNIPLATPGAPADNHCAHPSISGDGRYVAYIYEGGAAIPGAPAGPNAAYLIRRDRDAGSLTSTVMGDHAFAFSFGGPAATGTTSISNDGQLASYLGMNGPAASATDFEIRIGRLGGPPIAASRHVLAPGATLAFLPDTFLSADGRWVVWDAESGQEVLGDTNAVQDVFGYGPIR